MTGRAELFYTRGEACGDTNLSKLDNNATLNTEHMYHVNFTACTVFCQESRDEEVLAPEINHQECSV